MLNIINTPEKRQIMGACIEVLGDDKVKEITYEMSKLVEDALKDKSNGEILVSLVSIILGAQQGLSTIFDEAIESMEE